MRDSILGIGAVVMDYIAILAEYPSEDTKNPILEHSPSATTLGGPTPVKLIFLTQLGWETSLIATVGDDGPGEEIRHALINAKVDTTYLITQPGKRSAYSQVWLSEKTASRTQAYSNSTLDPIDFDQETLAKLVARTSAVLMDAREPAVSLAAAEIAEQYEVPVILDSGTYRPHTKKMIQASNAVQVPFRTAVDMFNSPDLITAAQQIQQLGPDLAVVTNGKDGSAYATSDGESSHMPAFSVNALDTLGAGDIFGAGLAHGLLNNMSARQSVEWASAAAALKCSRWGKDDLPTREEIELLIKGRIN